MKIRIVGKFFDNHSLAIVNRNLAMGFHNIGHEVSIIALDRPDQKYKVNQDTVNFLVEKIESELHNVDVEIRHTYPPMWKKYKRNQAYINDYQYPNYHFVFFHINCFVLIPFFKIFCVLILCFFRLVGIQHSKNID